MATYRFRCIDLALVLGMLPYGNAKAQALQKPAQHEPVAIQPYNPLILPGPPSKPGESSVWRTTIQSEQPKEGKSIPLSDGRFIGVPSAGFQTEFQTDTSDPSNLRIKSTWQTTGAEHVFFGKVEFGGFGFDSDASFPLTFQLTTSGYQYLCGRGTVRSEEKVYTIDGNGDFHAWLSRLADKRSLVRQGAAEALGWLAKSDIQKKQALKMLAISLRDSDARVRRDAAEAIGKIGPAPDTKIALAEALRDEKDSSVVNVLKQVAGEDTPH